MQKKILKMPLFFHSRKGSVAIEFVMLGVPFFLIILSLIVNGLSVLVSQHWDQTLSQLAEDVQSGKVVDGCPLVKVGEGPGSYDRVNYSSDCLKSAMCERVKFTFAFGRTCSVNARFDLRWIDEESVKASGEGWTVPELYNGRNINDAAFSDDHEKLKEGRAFFLRAVYFYKGFLKFSGKIQFLNDGDAYFQGIRVIRIRNLSTEIEAKAE